MILNLIHSPLTSLNLDLSFHVSHPNLDVIEEVLQLSWAGDDDGVLLLLGEGGDDHDLWHRLPRSLSIFQFQHLFHTSILFFPVQLESYWKSLLT